MIPPPLLSGKTVTPTPTVKTETANLKTVTETPPILQVDSETPLSPTPTLTVTPTPLVMTEFQVIDPVSSGEPEDVSVPKPRPETVKPVTPPEEDLLSWAEECCSESVDSDNRE